MRESNSTLPVTLAEPSLLCRRPPTISELRVREERARVALAVALHRALRTCATAARELDDLDAHVAAVRLRLRAAGYLR